MIVIATIAITIAGTGANGENGAIIATAESGETENGTKRSGAIGCSPA